MREWLLSQDEVFTVIRDFITTVKKLLAASRLTSLRLDSTVGDCSKNIVKVPQATVTLYVSRLVGW